MRYYSYYGKQPRSWLVVLLLLLALLQRHIVDVNCWTTKTTTTTHTAACCTTATATRGRILCGRRAKRTRLYAQQQQEPSSRNKKKVVIVGAGWAGLSAAHTLLQQHQQSPLLPLLEVTLVDAAPRVGGLVRDGYVSNNSTNQFKTEAGQHGFWNNYHNIFQLLEDANIFGTNALHDILTDYAPQGQYSPRGLEAVWPVYQKQTPRLPTGLAQLAYTKFLGLPLLDRISALPLVVAFSELANNDDETVINKYDEMSFYDLCRQLGVSNRCYDEAFEPMILTGLFAPGRECSAAAALGMAYFFVLQSQEAFDVQWCKGSNIGDVIFTPWLESMMQQKQTSNGGGLLRLESSTKVVDFEIIDNVITKVYCKKGKNETRMVLEADHVILAVGGPALAQFARFCPSLAAYPEFRRFANLRGTSVLATRLYLDKHLSSTYSANACWGFDDDVGMTFFDIRALHGPNATTVRNCPGAVFEVDYYNANALLVMSDNDLIAKVKSDLDNLLGVRCEQAKVVDAALVRFPNAVNWYFPGSYKLLPELKARSVTNLYFCGDIVKSSHGSWSQEKAFVTGRQAANLVLGRPQEEGLLPMGKDEIHVKLGKDLVALAKNSLMVLGGGARSLQDLFS